MSANPYAYSNENQLKGRGSPPFIGEINQNSNIPPQEKQYQNYYQPNNNEHLAFQHEQQQKGQSNFVPSNNNNFGFDTNGFPQFLEDSKTQVASHFAQKAFGNFFQGNGMPSDNVSNNMAFNSSFYNLSYYFQVSNSYVLHKLKIIILPFINSTWYRIQDNIHNASINAPINSSRSESLSYLPPKLDVNCPDLYIPTMGLITYILCWNLDQGLKGSFDPQNLYYKLSSTLAFVLLDLLILKLGLYLLIPSGINGTKSNNANYPNNISANGINNGGLNIVELVCFVGYKFVPLTLVLLLRGQFFTISGIIFMFLRIYLFLAFGVFLLRSVKFNLLPPIVDSQSAVNIDRKSVIKKCNYFLFFYGFIWQVLLMWLMG
ncbi:related to Protein transport protein YIF1 [Saccharomycodes ludwigii]|uniref:Protein YIF1 n=1 Tax=Saccharomycodes ludwigii TaxID=36035 RepID=A0A376B143_9ASCO|nr:hypothetical protein SCDLUD_003904 [Saccharomycodes ludwigii]KAH3899624.1 hypothetical protein SCDLUD_003904 [Saccharomycodes ludwigii]SSD58405.1 related to Protein transport protein YIF1 [Saccharomycodes ludwigii]